MINVSTTLDRGRGTLLSKIGVHTSKRIAEKGYDVVRRELGYDVVRRELGYDVVRRELGYDVVRRELAYFDDILCL